MIDSKWVKPSKCLHQNNQFCQGKIYQRQSSFWLLIFIWKKFGFLKIRSLHQTLGFVTVRLIVGNILSLLKTKWLWKLEGQTFLKVELWDRRFTFGRERSLGAPCDICYSAVFFTINHYLLKHHNCNFPFNGKDIFKFKISGIRLTKYTDNW